MQNIELITTKDGSHSLYRSDLDEQYHSIFGAIQESLHIFIKCGFDAVTKKHIQVFEMGFGTGLNALLTRLKCIETNSTVTYYSIEKYPLSESIMNQLNYSSILASGNPELFKEIAEAGWNSKTVLGLFTIRKIHANILNYEIPDGNDIIYFDAFSPDKEPELWTESIFRRLYNSMNEGGIFVTYSAKGEVRRKLLTVGFKVEKLAGPPGKLHILRAVK